MSSIYLFSVLKNLKKKYNLSLSQLSKITGIKIKTLESYEFNNSIPSFKNTILISKALKVSLDYLLLGDSTKYIKNTHFFELASSIDKLSVREWQLVFGYINTFLENKNKAKSSFDELKYDFSESFNENLKLLMDKKKITSKEFSYKFDLSERQVAGYRKKSECSYETLIDIASFFNISLNCLLMGKKLKFDFRNNEFLDTIFLADKHLDHKYINMSIEMMEKILEENSKKKHPTQ